nr:MAG TPA: hypothetical protein [Caudoviricetes sp.]
MHFLRLEIIIVSTSLYIIYRFNVLMSQNKNRNILIFLAMKYAFIINSLKY